MQHAPDPSKNPGDIQIQPSDGKDYDPSHDLRDMYRLGKSQQLKRRFRYFSLAAYIVVLGNCWEIAIVTSVFGLGNGGTGGAIWMTLFVCFGVSLTTTSMAEVASMAPTAGGQYHWVSEIAPRQVQKQLSYAVGWLGLTAWQISLSSCAYFFSNQILALITLCKPGFVTKGWQASLITIASSFAAVFLSVTVMEKLSLAQYLAVAAHVLGFIAFTTILWTMGPGPHTSAYDVFFTFDDANGWGSKGLAALVGIIGPAATFMGGDPAVHLAEELRDASYTLSRAMIYASGVNYLTGVVTLITFMFNIGSLDEDELFRYYNQPWVAVIYRITDSRAATIVFIVIICVNFFTLQVNTVMTSSRQLWAFARDHALPYSTWLAQVPSDGIPRNAVVVTLIVTFILSLIVIGSSAAFNIVLSITIASSYACYIAIIGTIVYRRFDGNEFPPTRFSLGPWGLPINVLALCYLVLTFVFLFFPAAPRPPLDEMNFAIVMFGALLLVAFSWYFFRARKTFDGPVEYVRKVDDEVPL